jgi:hypothetical protein
MKDICLVGTVVVDNDDRRLFDVNMVLIENFFDNDGICIVDVHNCEQMESIRKSA